MFLHLFDVYRIYSMLQQIFKVKTEKPKTEKIRGIQSLTLGQKYDVGGRSTVILYVYINRHTRPPNATKAKRQYSTTVFVCVFSSHSFWTSSSLDVPAGVTQEEGHTGFLIYLLSAVRALIFLARRIQPFLSLVDRQVEFCVLTI